LKLHNQAQGDDEKLHRYPLHIIVLFANITTMILNKLHKQVNPMSKAPIE
jgi:hypothetical protein